MGRRQLLRARRDTLETLRGSIRGKTANMRSNTSLIEPLILRFI